MNPQSKRKADLFGILVFIAVIIIAVVVYLNWQKEIRKIPFEEPPKLTSAEIQDKVDAFVDQSSGANEEDPYFPETALTMSKDKLIVVGSSDELTFIQSVSKDDPTDFTLSTPISEKSLTSIDIHRGKGLIAYTTKERDGVVTGLYLLNPQTLEKKLLKENIKNERFINEVQFSKEGDYISFMVNEGDNRFVEFFSIVDKRFNRGVNKNNDSTIIFSRWTNQGKIIAVDTQNRILTSKSKNEPYVFEVIELEGKDESFKITEAIKSPKEDILLLTGKFTEKDDPKTTLFIYNINTHKKRTEIKSESSLARAVWSTNGQYIYVSENDAIYLYNREDEFSKSESPLIEGVGEMALQVNENTTAFKKSFSGSNEMLFRVDIWETKEKKKLFSSDPLSLVSVF